MRIETLFDLSHEARRIVEQLRADKTAMIVGDDGAPAAYLVEPQTYQAALDRLGLLEALAVGERDLAEGRTLSHEQVKSRMARWSK